MGKPERISSERAAPETITIAVPEDTLATMRAAVAAGEYWTEGEIVREALHAWNERRERDQAKLEWLRAEIDKGLEGPFLDGEEAMAQLRARIVEEAARRRA